eukprot:4154605-Ditylum_brightwellii.AAC.2
MFVRSRESRHFVGRLPSCRSLDVRKTCFWHSAKMVNATNWLPPRTPTPKLLDWRHSLAKPIDSILATSAAITWQMPVPVPMGQRDMFPSGFSSHF